MEPVVSFKGTVTWKQFRRAQFKHVGIRWLFLFLWPVVMTVYVFLMLETLLIMSLIVVFIVSCNFVPLMLGFMILQWRRTYTKSPYLHQPLVGSVSSDTLVVEGVTGRTEMRWNQFVQIKDGKDFILLYHAPNLFNILACEFFESDAAWEITRKFAMRGVTGKDVAVADV